ncbi:MAG: toxin-antitoxin system HicB family antitoxin [bacterium]
MRTLTIRLPEDTHERLRALARHRKVSPNQLVEELSTAAIAELAAETRFRGRAALGSPEEALRSLDELDR